MSKKGFRPVIIFTIIIISSSSSSSSNSNSSNIIIIFVYFFIIIVINNTFVVIIIIIIIIIVIASRIATISKNCRGKDFVICEVGRSKHDMEGNGINVKEVQRGLSIIIIDGNDISFLTK